MATITVRNLSEDTVNSLKQKAAASGRSMEQEARALLTRWASDRAAAIRVVMGLWPRIKRPVSAADVDRWLAAGRRGR
jgi:hypothetical protein